MWINKDALVMTLSVVWNSFYGAQKEALVTFESLTTMVETTLNDMGYTVCKNSCLDEAPSNLYATLTDMQPYLNASGRMLLTGAHVLAPCVGGDPALACDILAKLFREGHIKPGGDDATRDD